mgnify:FL=1
MANRANINTEAVERATRRYKLNNNPYRRTIGKHHDKHKQTDLSSKFGQIEKVWY